MSATTDAALPAYTNDDVRKRLLDAGASGTVYALVMPESEDAFEIVVDRRQALLDRYHAPWTRKQDAMHREWFDTWTQWSAPVVKFNPNDFCHQYPTAGASEGIYKVMAEWAAKIRSGGQQPIVHIFEGEYEGFTAFAKSLDIEVVQHDRSKWREACEIEGDGQFWISQPSAIDGMVWNDFHAFAEHLAMTSPQVELVPDLSYVGAVARDYEIRLTSPNISTFLVSQSKPFGVYYHRIGGIFSKKEIGAAVGNIWFKNLLSLALGVKLMRRHDVFDLPRQYRIVQEEAAKSVGDRLGVPSLVAADVFVMGIAPAADVNDATRTLLRGCKTEQVVRVCLTPAMTVAIDPTMAPEMTARLEGKAE